MATHSHRAAPRDGGRDGAGGEGRHHVVAGQALDPLALPFAEGRPDVFGHHRLLGIVQAVALGQSAPQRSDHRLGQLVGDAHQHVRRRARRRPSGRRRTTPAAAACSRAGTAAVETPSTCSVSSGKQVRSDHRRSIGSQAVQQFVLAVLQGPLQSPGQRGHDRVDQLVAPNGHRIPLAPGVRRCPGSPRLAWLASLSLSTSGSRAPAVRSRRSAPWPPLGPVLGRCRARDRRLRLRHRFGRCCRVPVRRRPCGPLGAWRTGHRPPRGGDRRRRRPPRCRLGGVLRWVSSASAPAAGLHRRARVGCRPLASRPRGRSRSLDAFGLVLVGQQLRRQLLGRARFGPLQCLTAGRLGGQARRCPRRRRDPTAMASTEWRTSCTVSASSLPAGPELFDLGVEHLAAAWPGRPAPGPAGSGASSTIARHCSRACQQIVRLAARLARSWRRPAARSAPGVQPPGSPALPQLGGRDLWPPLPGEALGPGPALLDLLIGLR